MGNKNPIAEEIATILGGELDSATINPITGKDGINYISLRNEHGDALCREIQSWGIGGFMKIMKVSLVDHRAVMLLIQIGDDVYHLRGFRADNFIPDESFLSKIHVGKEEAAWKK